MHFQMSCLFNFPFVTQNTVALKTSAKDLQVAESRLLISSQWPWLYVLRALSLVHQHIQYGIMGCFPKHLLLVRGLIHQLLIPLTQFWRRFLHLHLCSYLRVQVHHHASFQTHPILCLNLCHQAKVTEQHDPVENKEKKEWKTLTLTITPFSHKVVAYNPTQLPTPPWLLTHYSLLLL